MTDLRYPIGKFSFEGSNSEDERVRRRLGFARRSTGCRRNSLTRLTARKGGPCASLCITFPIVT
jgi:hypothetical protein